MSDPVDPYPIAEYMLRTLSGREQPEASGHARAMLAAASAYLFGALGPQPTLEALDRCVRTVQAGIDKPSPPLSFEAADATLGYLRALPRDEAHERARGAVAGGAAYLHETHGALYASAVLDGTLQAAAEHGDMMRGGRPSGTTLH